MRKIFRKSKPSIKNHGSYKYFSNEAHEESLLHELSEETFVNNDGGLQRFCDININILIDMRRVRQDILKVIKCYL